MIQNGESWQSMPLSRFKVVEVMGRRDLDGAGAELAIHEDRIAHDRDRRASSAEGGLACRSDGDSVRLPDARPRRYRRASFQDASWRPSTPVFGSSANGITDGVEFAVDLFMLHFDVGERRQAARAPVDQPLAAIDQPVFVQPDEDLADGLRQALRPS